MFFSREKLHKRIAELSNFIVRKKAPVGLKFKQGEIEGAFRPDFDDVGWENVKQGFSWGGRDVKAWFRGKITIPHDFDKRSTELMVELAGGGRGFFGDNVESLVYINGSPVQGSDQNHKEVLLPEDVLDKGELDIAIKAWSTLSERPHTLQGVTLVEIDEKAEDLYYTMYTLITVAKVLGYDSLKGADILRVLDEAERLIDWSTSGSDEFYEELSKALDYIKSSDVYDMGEDYGKVICVGHSHIDVAWLWRYCHTREKASRTFSTVLNLMKKYPEYRFIQSQPQLYKFIKQDYPEIYEGIKEAVKEGKWEPEGGMWVEADCNLISGESMVRQFLFGTRFFEKEFGVKNEILWLPDVFGYSWALPQILRRSGFKYFMTTKISWNQFNRPQYDTFKWRGMDGSEILTHFITTPGIFEKDMEKMGMYVDEVKMEGMSNWSGTYNGDIDPRTIKGIWDQYRQKDINSEELLLAFGFGDGGGGPTKEMLEMARHMKGLPVPKCEMGKAEPFFERLEKRVGNNPYLPVVDGELYLEYHRGTYTSQAKNKKSNRKSEILYHDAELLNTIAKDYASGHQYPQSELNEGWEMILTNQFHDVIPGSAIHEVYEDSAEMYKRVKEIGDNALCSSLKAIADNIDIKDKAVVLFNTLSWDRSDYVKISLDEVNGLFGTDGYNEYYLSDGAANVPCETCEEDGKMFIKAFVTVPSMGYKVYDIKRGNVGEGKISVSKDSMENKFYLIKLNENGEISSIYDKVNKREALSGDGNVIEAFEDKPMNFDNWDIDIFYMDKKTCVHDLESIQAIPGEESARVRVKRKFRDSLIEQDIIIYRNKKRIDFKTKIDWHEKQTLLKAAFPVNVRATKATYEIQYGNVERPTHWNTSWDYAKFEVLGHKWADLSQGNYGVSLLNDCKYGHSIKNNVMKLTLLKSGINPDPMADKCLHEFTYSLYPHKGGWYLGGTVKEAYELNYPIDYVLTDAHGGAQDNEKSFVSVDVPDVIVEVVKKAEDGDDTIVRMYEFAGCDTKVNVRFDKEVKDAYETNLMEKEPVKAPFSGNTLTLNIKPYEIRTFKLTF